jgi:hypothetical protein
MGGDRRGPVESRVGDTYESRGGGTLVMDQIVKHFTKFFKRMEGQVGRHYLGAGYKPRYRGPARLGFRHGQPITA